MDTIECILTRRSVRSFKDPGENPVPADLVKKLVSCAAAAPSACNQKPWHFVAVDDRNLLTALSKENIHGRMLAHAALAVAVCFDDSEKPYPKLVIDDCSAATENMLLVAHALGYGAVWLGIHHDEKKQESTKRILKLPENITVMSIVAVGMTKVFPSERADNFIPEMLHTNGW
jgi:nitroreductase